MRSLEVEYLKRLRKWLPCELVEIERETIRQGGDSRRVHAAELRKLEHHLGGGSSFAVLDSRGRQYNSEEWADWLEDRMREGLRELVFILGGPLGLSEALVGKARWKIALSRLTFTHQMARLILLESLYRSLAIAEGTAYHK